MVERDDVMAEDWTYAVDILPYLREPDETDNSSLETFTSENGTDQSLSDSMSILPHVPKHSVSSLPPSNGSFHEQVSGFNFRRAQSVIEISMNSRYSRELSRLSRDVEAICIQRDSTRIGRVLHKGEHSCVCSGTFRTPSPGYRSYMQPVSIHYSTDLNLEEDKRAFLLNMATLARLRHEHVAGVLGVCVDGSPQSPAGVDVITVMPKLSSYVTLHNMLSYTRENNPKLLSVSSLLGYAEQICKGIDYLQEQKIIHRHMKASTCLIDDNFTLKLSDVHVRPLSGRQLDIRWLPLEVIQHKSYTTRGMVWTVGIVLWELMALGVTPYPHLETAAVQTYVVNGKRLISPDGCSSEVYGFMCECWKEKPKERITISGLLSKITTYRNQLPAVSSAREIFQNIDEFWEDEYI